MKTSAKKAKHKINILGLEEFALSDYSLQHKYIYPLFEGMTNHETHLSTQQEKTPKDVRVPQTHENCQRTSSDQPTSQSRKKETRGLNNSFPKSLRVRTNNHYQSIIKNGFRAYGTAVVFDIRKGRVTHPRLGITVSKRYGKAHDRNRFKRFVREAFRLSVAHLPSDVEINVSPRYPITKLPTLPLMLSEFAAIPRLIEAPKADIGRAKALV